MSYRDDVDALYERAAALERDLERARAELARRDAAVPPAPVREWRTTPRPLRELPAAEASLAALIDSFVPTPPPPAPAKPQPQLSDREVARATTQRIAHLDTECLLLVGAIVEQLVAGPSEQLRGQLRAIVLELFTR